MKTFHIPYIHKHKIYTQPTCDKHYCQFHNRTDCTHSNEVMKTDITILLTNRFDSKYTFQRTTSQSADENQRIATIFESQVTWKQPECCVTAAAVVVSIWCE